MRPFVHAQGLCAHRLRGRARLTGTARLQEHLGLDTDAGVGEHVAKARIAAAKRERVGSSDTVGWSDHRDAGGHSFERRPDIEIENHPHPDCRTHLAAAKLQMADPFSTGQGFRPDRRGRLAHVPAGRGDRVCVLE